MLRLCVQISSGAGTGKAEGESTYPKCFDLSKMRAKFQNTVHIRFNIF